jgi:pimeloyl-ACP methyl ester carboxylesterase
MPDAERVLLLHGIAGSVLQLSRLERALSNAGYQTLNLRYAGRHNSLEQLLEQVHRDAAWFLDQTAGQTHFVTHSMGGLLARALITRYRPAALGRVVMLAPPNQGSELSDLLARTAAYRRFFGPAGLQLRTTQDDKLRELLGAVDYPLGIIAGSRSLDPLCWLIIPGPNDGRVSVARTALDGMADNVTIPATHTFIMRNRTAIEQTIQFLRHGCFCPASPRPVSHLPAVSPPGTLIAEPAVVRNSFAS